MDFVLGVMLAIYDWLNENTLAIIPIFVFWFFQRRARTTQNRVVQAEKFLSHINAHSDEMRGADFDKVGMMANLMRYTAEIAEYLRIISAATMALLVYVILLAIS